MSWRVVKISNRAKLDYRMNYVVVRGEETVKIHISEISTLIIENTAVSLTAALISELIKNKVKVIFCDESRNPTAELVPYYGSHDTSAKVRSQINWSPDTKQAVWTMIVKEKIKKQAELLRSNEAINNAEMLENYASEVEFGDATNREGVAAKVYFNTLFGVHFSRNHDNNINAALNYGYSILLSAFSREVTSSGYITQLGIFHNNTFNQFNLACDLMEPFRPLVDDIVLNLQHEEFGREDKNELIKVLNKEVLFDGQITFVSNAIGRYCKSIFDCLNEGDLSAVKFYTNIPE